MYLGLLSGSRQLQTQKNKTEDPLIIVTAVTAGSSCGVVTTKTANTDWKKICLSWKFVGYLSTIIWFLEKMKQN